MAKIKEEAQTYESKLTKSIAELKNVSIDLEVEERTAIDKKGNEFSYNVVAVAGEEYRIPDSVLKSLKVILVENPNLKTFKVIKSGQGMQTEYTVIPLV